jgi:hypothetical protein
VKLWRTATPAKATNDPAYAERAFGIKLPPALAKRRK